ncbi:MAG: helix-turn-helix domain-containing protein [Bryobacterales bacterium]|nr:helix-turn-helix domain-containing protein [Bryobacterales bacterium]
MHVSPAESNFPRNGGGLAFTVTPAKTVPGGERQAPSADTSPSPARNWTTSDAKVAVQWARTEAPTRRPLRELAAELDRTEEAVKEFLRRTLPREQWPWRRKPRWASREMEQIQKGLNLNGRSRAAVRKHRWRERNADRDVDRQPLTVAQVAQDIGRSRTTVQRLLKEGILRRFKGGIAESSFEAFLRDHPDRIPYEKLPPAQREWLVLNGFQDHCLAVKAPSVHGLLE